ncbi:unnamed protein product [Strongylus vulgaris]|uniref:Uncharacterized protein n=1 Tax=Strongylus vulgaris TaxID=40348 RepID=A0A3P7JJD8_STRVU|nr:unnamed protein product [Strongylus vulgaris]
MKIQFFLVDQTLADVMKMVDTQWMDRFVPREYKKSVPDNGDEANVSKDNNYGYSEQGMKDLDEVLVLILDATYLALWEALTLPTYVGQKQEVGGLVGGGDSELLGILRPYYSVVDMSANGNKQGMGSYLHVLPDSSEGDEPVYTLGASFYGGLEPAGAKIGYLTRPFG